MSVQFHPRSPAYALTNFDKISTSSAIQKYSFSKGSRFKDVKVEHHRCGYELPSTFRAQPNKGAGFGYGERELPSKGSDSPSPVRYDLGSFVDKFNFQKSQTSSQLKSTESKNQPKTYCFGTGRNQFNSSVYNEKKSKLYPDPIVPGPGTYCDLSRNIGVQSRKNQCHGKLDGFDDASISRKRAIPGPGTYEDQTKLDPIGKYQISTYNNSKASNFSTGKRFKSIGLATPGPGTYQTFGNTAASHHGSTAFHTILTRTLGTTEKQRPEVIRFNTPGPGQYRTPSDFGYMDALVSPKKREQDVESIFNKNKYGSTLTNFENCARNQNSLGLRATPRMGEVAKVATKSVFSIRMASQQKERRKSELEPNNNRIAQERNQQVKAEHEKPVITDPLSSTINKDMTTQAFSYAAGEFSPLTNTSEQWQIQSQSIKSYADASSPKKKIRRDKQENVRQVCLVYSANLKCLGGKTFTNRKYNRNTSSSLDGRNCTTGAKSKRTKIPANINIIPYQLQVKPVSPKVKYNLDIERTQSIPMSEQIQQS